ncbi:hypothetical protein IDM40_03525 [Nocardiopsis sp. HNM0947]|uniref:Abi-like protein n=1 Tax=Nocardiopsis coralli TaxID=2772213 RepID=A0ABR9P1R7_9ACTN|nr:hypothetical protein [Nocardiopsis coralli]MBE2997783.1 hypothetical protein [Nocardiopsis coralli]
MPDVDDAVSIVWKRLSEPRMAPYLKKAGGSRFAALAVYEWSTRTAAAAFEDIGHLEVLLRNTLDDRLREHFHEERCGIPWFLRATPVGDRVAEAVQKERARLRREQNESRDQIVAGLTFGFWSALLGTKYEDLWRECLHRAFPHASGRRKDVALELDAVRKFRNRIAHHDSMLNVDVPFETRRIFRLARYMDPEVADWLERRSRVLELYRDRPVQVEDTVVVAAKQAWPLYEKCHAYVCQAGRTFREVDRIAFYADQEIKLDVPMVVHRRDHVEWTTAASARLRASQDGRDQRIADVIEESRAQGWTEGRYQVFLLTHGRDPRHRQLPVCLPHTVVGRGTAFTQRQRYTSLHALETADSTADLCSSGKQPSPG